ncbi:carbohydrate ABC transporter permease [Cohnella thailandensis]|uniref:Carbohydrate ABC transporter permease n=1 Tax=Cohnella thailandensis TaxID=557557 RepID=A0A841SVG1_9BACL|nr:carbohydrate ABC transporter permease [Cohnella thailandensis]MBB6635904.1 carbohydrate ABC transporter permease [Cohnella thailandensis]MBP1976282.1 ABC-type glycerol-3-phosphate transport system permease component [Cohnella thailandensis]
MNTQASAQPAGRTETKPARRRRKIDWKDFSFNAINYFILTILILITIYPFYYIFVYSISDSIEAQKGVTFWPAGFSLEAYQKTLTLPGIKDAAIVSLSRTVLGTILTVLCCSFFAYLITKEEMLLRKYVYRFVLITMYFNAGFIPWYLTMKTYGLQNNFLLYIVPSALAGFNVILIKTFIEQLPASLEESAKIDGAGYMRIFTSIIFPLSMPIIATIAVFAAVGQWSTWFDNWFLVENPKLQTLQLVLYTFLNQSSNLANATTEQLNRGDLVRTLTPQSIQMTITMLVTLPIVLVYPLLQRYFVKGIMMGAVKG